MDKDKTVNLIETVQLLGDKVLVERLPDEELRSTATGIYVHDAHDVGLKIGLVIASGPGRRTENGMLVHNLIKKGDKVIYQFGGTEVTIFGKKYVLFNEPEIIAVQKPAAASE